METIERPGTSEQKAFLAEIGRGGIELDDDYAVSLGTSVCTVAEANGAATARDYTKPMLQAATGKTPTDAQVRTFVTASTRLC